MRTIPRAYEKGEFVLIFYLPILLTLVFLVNRIQEYFPILTYNHVFLIETGLHVLLAGALALIFLDIKNVSDKRLKTTDWFLRIGVALFFLVSILVILNTIVQIAIMLFSDSFNADFLREHFGYNGAFKQILLMGIMFAGAWIWLKGINKGHAVLAISGMVIVMLINPPDSYVQSKFRQMKQQEMESISMTGEELSAEEIKGEEQESVKQRDSRMQHNFVVGSDKIQGLWFPFRTPRFYGVALMLFTLVRYQKPKEQLE